MFDSLSLPLNLGLFALLAVIIWQAGTKLSYFIDAIAEHTKIARAFLGLVFLASATGLPEVATTISASLSGSASLALNNMFGGIAMQTAVLAVVDMALCRRPLTSYPQSTIPAIEAALLILALAGTLAVGLLGDWAIVGHLGISSLGLGLFYGGALYWLQRWQHAQHWSPVDLPDDIQSTPGERQNRYDAMAVSRLSLLSLVASAVILAAGYALVKIAEVLSVQTGLGDSFVGASLLAATTSLPELSTTVAAVRVQAHSMAISNVVGSNLIMIFLILPADLAFAEGAILNWLDAAGSLALISGIAVTAVLTVGLLVRSRRRVLGAGVDSLVILVLYIGTLCGLYALR